MGVSVTGPFHLDVSGYLIAPGYLTLVRRVRGRGPWDCDTPKDQGPDAREEKQTKGWETQRPNSKGRFMKHMGRG